MELKKNMPAEFEKMRKEIKKSILADHPGMSDEDAESKSYAIATSQWKKSHGGKGPSERATLNFSYNMPIEEFGTVESDFIIAGTAINATITSNNHKFLPEVLEKSAATLIGVPLLVDHDNRVESIKGRVFHARYDEANQKIPFKAKVMDNNIKTMIKDGRLNSVSVGASVDPKNIEEDTDGTIIPRDITFKELSLVAVPADEGATFGIALKEAYRTFQDENDDKEEPEKEEEEVEEKVKDNVQETDNLISERRENMEEQTEAAKVAVEVKEVAKEKTELGKMMEENEKLKLEIARKENEALREKLKKAEVKEAAKMEVEEEEETEEIIPGYKLLEGAGSLRGRAISMIRNKYR